MIYGIFAIVIGIIAVLLSKFVLPKLQAKVEEQARIQNEKKAEKE